MDEKLLAQLDAAEETKKDGRSAVLRRAAAEYLKARRRQSIAEQYHRAYAKSDGLGAEFEGWDKLGVWPED